MWPAVWRSLPELIISRCIQKPLTASKRSKRRLPRTILFEGEILSSVFAASVSYYGQGIHVVLKLWSLKGLTWAQNFAILAWMHWRSYKESCLNYMYVKQFQKTLSTLGFCTINPKLHFWLLSWVFQLAFLQNNKSP